jgi:hypothetical protein
MKPIYRITRTKRGKYYITKKFLCFWIMHRPLKSATYMYSFHHAELELECIKKYNKAIKEVVHEE